MCADQKKTSVKARQVGAAESTLQRRWLAEAFKTPVVAREPAGRRGTGQDLSAVGKLAE